MYEREALKEALRQTPLAIEDPTLEARIDEIADIMVDSLHEQQYRLTSDGISFDE